jgi:hypothetical protein
MEQATAILYFVVIATAAFQDHFMFLVTTVSAANLLWSFGDEYKIKIYFSI